MWSHERETMIQRLLELYPYPIEWYRRLTTAQITAMYLKPTKQNNAAKIVKVRVPQETHRRDNPEDKGQTLVKTDGHGWEPEYN